MSSHPWFCALSASRIALDESNGMESSEARRMVPPSVSTVSALSSTRRMRPLFTLALYAARSRAFSASLLAGKWRSIRVIVKNSRAVYPKFPRCKEEIARGILSFGRLPIVRHILEDPAVDKPAHPVDILRRRHRVVVLMLFRQEIRHELAGYPRGVRPHRIELLIYLVGEL